MAMITAFAHKFRYVLTGLEVTGIVLISLLILGMQFIFHEPPCAVCLLERVGYLGIASSFLLNFRFGLKPSHYVISLLFASFTALAEVQQIARYIDVADFWHNTSALYWYAGSVIVCVGAMIFSTIMIGIDSVYRPQKHLTHRHSWITHGLFLLVTLVIISNIVFS